MDRAALDLLHQCELARGRGSDFPTIWLTILRTHPLVTGLPGHEVRNGEALIVVRLLTGEKLASSPLGFRFI